MFYCCVNQTVFVTTLVGGSVVARGVFRNFPISLPDSVTRVDLVELDMVNFDVILGMDWSHAFFSSIDCRT